MVSQSWLRTGTTAVIALAVLAGCTEPTPTAPTDFSVRYARPAPTTGPSVTSTSPNSSARGVTLDVRVLGSGFDAGSKAQWAFKGTATPKVTTNSTRFVSSRELVANISIAADADPALYDVIVITGGGKPGIGTETFEITVEQTDLGNLGVASAEALAVNDAGQIVGVAAVSTTSSRAFLWENGVMRNLGVPAGFQNSRAEGINNNGQVAGYSMVQVNGVSTSRAFVWTNAGGYQLLPTFNGATSNQAMEINDHGMVVGRSGDHAVAWINGAVVDLQTFATGTSSAWDVNNAGEVVGTYTAPGSTAEAFRWTQATGMQLVRTMSSSWGEALGINDSGVIVGWGAAPGTSGNSAYLNRGGVPENLGITGGPNSAAIKISGNGLVSGRAGAAKAALWYPGGSMLLLHAPRATGTSVAVDINVNGWAVGHVVVPGRRGSDKIAVRWRVF